MNFYYAINDIDILARVRTVITRFIDDANHIIYDDVNKIDFDVTDSIFLIDHSLDYFQEKINDDHQNILVVINDVLNDFEDYPAEVYISKSRVITSLSGVAMDLKNSKSFSGNFFSIDLESIDVGKITPCDLYLKINEEKYLKCVKSDDLFDLETKERFYKKSKYLWVEREDFYHFGNFLYGEDDLENEVTSPFTVESINHLELIHDMAKSCGISDKTIRTVETSLTSVKDSATGKLKDLLGRFDELEGSFLHAHSFFTCLLCAEISSKQKWFKHQHIDKLMLASITHDLGYQNEKNALFEALPKSKIAQLEAEIQSDIFQHVDRVIKLLESSSSVDSDVINIIKRHHGARGEESYPLKSFATELDLLSGIFLLCHCFSISLFKMSFNLQKIDMILAYIDSIYNKGNLKQLLPDFKTEIKKLMQVS
ncbi:MAG: hypothetical protein HON90_00865 [Halobacteriovoraceae bacterium]|jgi:hypothetical protein|nr:hypothetical protein [Halobacteriovoraceae bacterium]